MQKRLKPLLIILFSIFVIVTSLVSFLSFYLIEEYNFNTSLLEDSNYISININDNNINELGEIYTNDENTKLVIFNDNNEIYFQNLEETYTQVDLINLKRDVNVIKNSRVDNEDGFGITRLNSNLNIYIYLFKIPPQSYYVSKNLTISIPIVLLILCGFYMVFDLILRKKETTYLKYQVRKLRNIVNIDSMVEYDDDVENLANILKDTRRQLDKELQNNYLSEKKINFILDSFEQGLLVVDLENNIILSNKKGRDILKLDSNDKRLKENSIVHDILINMKVVSSMDRGMIFNLEIDGKVYEISINNIYDALEENKITKSVSILIVDITEKFNSEKMKRDFFANAAHELKSPLTSILGYQELIKDGLISSKEELANANEKTMKESERMNKLIIEMLELSSLENNNLRPIEKIDVIKELDNILVMLEEQITAKNIKVIKNYKKLIIKMNTEDFYNLFKNLIENAIRYNKDNGKIYINIDIENHQISIKDTGLGVSDEDKQRIFERFYRVDKARSRKTGGTGLGLAIVKYICNYYDFKIEVKSKLNEGSEFIINF